MIDALRRGRPAFLVSVTSADEAELALREGTDVIDCKDPANGALGALDARKVREIVARVKGRAPVSATVGDLPADAEALVVAARNMAATGVDIVKIGFFGDADPRPAIAALGAANFAPCKLVAVMMADRQPDFSLTLDLARAGFAGAMLDTADKASGSLRTIISSERLRTFTRGAQREGLFAGLAGSLKLSDIGELAPLQPDVLGFRGALCAAGRVSALDLSRVAEARRALDAAPSAGPARQEVVA